MHQQRFLPCARSHTNDPWQFGQFCPDAVELQLRHSFAFASLVIRSTVHFPFQDPLFVQSPHWVWNLQDERQYRSQRQIGD